MATKTTLDQIAEAARVSLSTVDRVINNRGGVSPGRETRVLEAALRLKLDRVGFRTPLRTIRVAFVMASPSNPFYVRLGNAVTTETEALAHLNIRSFILHFERATADAIVARLRGLEKSYDAVVVTCPADARISAALRQISGRIPLITLSNDIPDSGRIAHFGPDEERSGRVAGELMGRFLGPGPAGILFISGFRIMSNQVERERGFRSVLAERFPDCSILASRESHDIPDRPGEIVLEEMRLDPGIRGIYNASAGSRSVARVLHSNRLAGRTVYITHELTVSRRELLRAGLIDAVIDQNLTVAARSALEFVAGHFGRGERRDRQPFTPFEIYMRENC